MKSLLLIGVIGFFLSGCGTAAKESEFWQHPTMFRNWDHMKYSWGNERSQKFTKESKEENWWGIPQKEVTAK